MLLQVRAICTEIDDPFGAALCAQNRVCGTPPHFPPQHLALKRFMCTKRQYRTSAATLSSATAASPTRLPAALRHATRSRSYCAFILDVSAHHCVGSACVMIRALVLCKRRSHGATS